MWIIFCFIVQLLIICEPLFSLFLGYIGWCCTRWQIFYLVGKGYMGGIAIMFLVCNSSLCCEDNLERTEWLYSLGSSPYGDFSFILLIIKKEIKKSLKPIYLNKLIEGRSSQIISLYSKAWNVDYPHLKMLRCLYN